MDILKLLTKEQRSKLTSDQLQRLMGLESDEQKITRFRKYVEDININLGKIDCGSWNHNETKENEKSVVELLNHINLTYPEFTDHVCVYGPLVQGRQYKTRNFSKICICFISDLAILCKKYNLDPNKYFISECCFGDKNHDIDIKKELHGGLEDFFRKKSYYYGDRPRFSYKSSKESQFGYTSSDKNVECSIMERIKYVDVRKLRKHIDLSSLVKQHIDERA